VAQKVVVELFDDVDGTKAVETVTFALDGRAYEIDLSEKNAAKLRKALAPYAEVGRRQGGSRRDAKRISTSRDTNRPDPSAVRAWAESQGIEVAARGRVPAEVIEKYQAAH
jgi:Lsr2